MKGTLWSKIHVLLLQESLANAR